MPFKYRFASTIRFKINMILKLDHFVNYCFSKNNFLNDSIAHVNERSTIKANISRTVRDTKMTCYTFGDTIDFFHSTKFDRNRCSRWMHFCLYMSYCISHVFLFTNDLSAILPLPAIEIPSIWLADRNLSSN